MNNEQRVQVGLQATAGKHAAGSIRAIQFHDDSREQQRTNKDVAVHEKSTATLLGTMRMGEWRADLNYNSKYMKHTAADKKTDG